MVLIRAKKNTGYNYIHMIGWLSLLHHSACFGTEQSTLVSSTPATSLQCCLFFCHFVDQRHLVLDVLLRLFQLLIGRFQSCTRGGSTIRQFFRRLGFHRGFQRLLLHHPKLLEQFCVNWKKLLDIKLRGQRWRITSSCGGGRV